jgi:chromate transporter
LGLTSFGGPVAHIGYFHEELVARRRWISDKLFTELVGLCQMLPGPASSQLGFAIGLHRGGYWGGAAAWLGFTLPSAILMVAAAYGLFLFDWSGREGILVGLKAAAVAVVAKAVWQLGRRHCMSVERLFLALVSGLLIYTTQHIASAIVAIVCGGLIGFYRFHHREENADDSFKGWAISRRCGALCLLLFFVLLLMLPLSASLTAHPVLLTGSAFYQSGALVFGGGHIVLPLLEVEVVRPGWIDGDVFLAGYGAAQALPGPLFSFSTFVGASLKPEFWILPAWSGGVLGLMAIYLPSWLLMIGVIPFWSRWRDYSGARGVVAGANAAVIGMLLAAFLDPVCLRGLQSTSALGIAVASLALLASSKVPAWLVVLLAGIVGLFL